VESIKIIQDLWNNEPQFEAEPFSYLISFSVWKQSI
jgi:hypothetical protein